jgi:apolipoprotein D and lipocalin family protein
MKYLIIIVFLVSCGHKPLKIVDKVDLKKYQGRWYEIARFNQFFQKDCGKSMANYSLRKDGDIKVVNSCIKKNGEIKSSEARAWSVSKENNKLKVQFFLKDFKIPFLAGDYWIIELDDNYTYAAVGDDSRDYLWILSRNKKMDKKTYKGLLLKLEKKGFDISKLIKFRD